MNTASASTVPSEWLLIQHLLLLPLKPFMDLSSTYSRKASVCMLLRITDSGKGQQQRRYVNINEEKDILTNQQRTGIVQKSQGVSPELVAPLPSPFPEHYDTTHTHTRTHTHTYTHTKLKHSPPQAKSKSISVNSFSSLQKFLAQPWIRERGVLEVLYIKRAHNPKDRWSSQV